MIMAIEVSVMTSGTALTAGSAYCTAAQGAGAGIMTGQTTGGVMNLATTIEWRRRCGMAGQTTGDCAHGMSMAMTVEVSAVTTLAVLAAGGSRSTAAKGAGTGVVTGLATAAAMSIGAAGERSAADYGMTAGTQSHGRHRMSMTMVIETGMTTGTVLGADRG